MNILELLLEARKPAINKNKFLRLYPFFEQNKNNKANTSIDTEDGANFLFRGYIYWLNDNYEKNYSEKFIDYCLDTLNRTEAAMRILGIKRTLETFDNIINAVSTSRTKFINNLIKEAKKKEEEKNKPQKQVQETPKEENQRGKIKSFKNNLTFSKEGKQGRDKKVIPHRGNPGNVKVRKNIISNLKEYENFIKEYPGKLIAGYNFIKSNTGKPKVLVYEINNRGPYFVYTNTDNSYFNYYKEGSNGIGTVSVKRIRDKINEDTKIINFMKNIGVEALKDLDYNSFLKRYYNSGSFFDLDNTKIVIKTWYLILRHILNRYKFKELEPLVITEEKFNYLKNRVLPMKGQTLKKAIGAFNNKNTMNSTALREWFESWDN